LFFLCFASVQNCETYPPAREKNKQVLKNKTASACCVDVKHNKNLIYFIYQQKKCSTKCKIENNDKRALQDLCNYKTIIRKFHKKTFFIEIFLCFSTFVVQNLPVCGRKTEKNKEMALRHYSIRLDSFTAGNTKHVDVNIAL
jgi:hypothetical protein